MVNDKDIALSAASIIRTLGAGASIECAQISKRWAGRGDQEAADLWLRIRKAVLQQELPAATPKAG
jgi:hypothetical protein